MWKMGVVPQLKALHRGISTWGLPDVVKNRLSNAEEQVQSLV